MTGVLYESKANCPWVFYILPCLGLEGSWFILIHGKKSRPENTKAAGKADGIMSIVLSRVALVGEFGAGLHVWQALGGDSQCGLVEADRGRFPQRVNPGVEAFNAGVGADVAFDFVADGIERD